MKTARYGLMLPAMGVFLMCCSQGFAQSQREDSSTGNSATAIAHDGQALALSQVPQPALNSAQKVLGTPPTEAKMVVGTNPQQYELSGMDKFGRAASVQVLQDGQMVKKEKAR